MYKELFSTDKVGVVIDTNEWLTGISYSRRVPVSDISERRGDLLEIGFLCFIIYVAIERKGRKS